MDNLDILHTLEMYDWAALLLIRLILAFIFLMASHHKSGDVKGFAKSNNLPLPIAWGLVFAESLCGISLLLGIFPRIAATIVMLIMLGSMSFHIFKWKSPYWAAKGGWEYDLMIFAMASIILVIGGGSISLLRL